MLIFSIFILGLFGLAGSTVAIVFIPAQNATLYEDIQIFGGSQLLSHVANETELNLANSRRNMLMSHGWLIDSQKYLSEDYPEIALAVGDRLDSYFTIGPVERDGSFRFTARANDVETTDAVATVVCKRYIIEHHAVQDNVPFSKGIVNRDDHSISLLLRWSVGFAVGIIGGLFFIRSIWRTTQETESD